MNFEKTNGNKVFTYHEIYLKKAATKRLLGITTDEHLNFNERVINKCKILVKNLMHCRECLLFLAIN